MRILFKSEFIGTVVMLVLLARLALADEVITPLSEDQFKVTSTTETTITITDVKGKLASLVEERDAVVKARDSFLASVDNYNKRIQGIDDKIAKFNDNFGQAISDYDAKVAAQKAEEEAKAQALRDEEAAKSSQSTNWSDVNVLNRNGVNWSEFPR